MKFEKPSEQSLKNTAAMAGGVVAGGMLSKGFFGIIHNPAATTDPTQLKKDQNMALIKRGVLVVSLGALAACITGKDTVTTLAQGAAIGVATTQATELIAQLASKSTITPEAQATTQAQKFLARAVGLGCPCNAPQAGLGNPVVMSERYAMYAPTVERAAYAPLNSSFSSGNILEDWASRPAA